jgi:hypothetical protein
MAIKGKKNRLWTALHNAEMRKRYIKWIPLWSLAGSGNKAIQFVYFVRLSLFLSFCSIIVRRSSWSNSGRDWDDEKEIHNRRQLDELDTWDLRIIIKNRIPRHHHRSPLSASLQLESNI